MPIDPILYFNFIYWVRANAFPGVDFFLFISDESEQTIAIVLSPPYDKRKDVSHEIYCDITQAGLTQFAVILRVEQSVIEKFNFISSRLRSLKVATLEQ